MGSWLLQPLEACSGGGPLRIRLDELEPSLCLAQALPWLRVDAVEPPAAGAERLAVKHLLEAREEAVRAAAELRIEKVGVVAARHLVERAVEADHRHALHPQALQVHPVLHRTAVPRLNHQLQRGRRRGRRGRRWRWAAAEQRAESRRGAQRAAAQRHERLLVGKARERATARRLRMRLLLTGVWAAPSPPRAPPPRCTWWSPRRTWRPAKPHAQAVPRPRPRSRATAPT
mmetsp:Transcript_16076/g.51564  ORF Transcript_16076/g.51564 Transcript_16076/m.51564 type:complete len:230 (+) Transcript_16076:117-806(+)